MINNNFLFDILDNLDFLNIETVTFPAYTFEIEYNLSADDKDYVTFSKNPFIPNICDKLMVCDAEVTTEPIYKDWYMTINYHS